MTYFEFTKRFPDETSAINFIVAAKYKNGYVCPKCGCVDRIYRYRKLLGGVETLCVWNIPSRFRETSSTICG